MKEIYLKYIYNASDIIVAYISAMAVIPIALGIVFGHVYLTIYLANKGIAMPWWFNETIMISTIILFSLLVFFFVSIGQSIWIEVKKYVAKYYAKNLKYFRKYSTNEKQSI